MNDVTTVGILAAIPPPQKRGHVRRTVLRWLIGALVIVGVIVRMKGIA